MLKFSISENLRFQNDKFLTSVTDPVTPETLRKLLPQKKKGGWGFDAVKRGEVSVETWTQILVYNNTLFMFRYLSTQ